MSTSDAAQLLEIDRLLRKLDSLEKDWDLAVKLVHEFGAESDRMRSALERIAGGKLKASRMRKLALEAIAREPLENAAPCFCGFPSAAMCPRHQKTPTR